MHHRGGIKICLYFTIKELILIFRSISLILLLRIVSLDDKRLFPIFECVDLSELKSVSLNVIVWLKLSSIKSIGGVWEL